MLAYSPETVKKYCSILSRCTVLYNLCVQVELYITSVDKTLLQQIYVGPRNKAETEFPSLPVYINKPYKCYKTQLTYGKDF
jgi:hypothetical protein